jgi:hypothetical protein
MFQLDLYGRGRARVNVTRLLLDSLSSDWCRLDEGVAESSLGRSLKQVEELWEDEAQELGDVQE